MEEEVRTILSDAVCLAVELDRRRIASFLGQVFDPEAQAIRQRGLNRLPLDPPAHGDEVQALHRPWIDEALQAIQLEAQRTESLGWLVLARAGMGLLWNAIDQRFTWADHVNIMRMFSLAAFQYGKRQDYFSRYGSAVQVDSDDPNASFPRLSNSELRAVRRLLHLCIILFEAEKAFRMAARNVGFSRDGEFGLVAHYDNWAVSNSLEYYDARVNDQLHGGSIFTAAGVTGSMASEALPNDSLFHMVPLEILEIQDAQAHTAIRLEIATLFPDMLVPPKFLPHEMDAKPLRVLERLPNSTREKANGLQPNEVLACFQGLGDLAARGKSPSRFRFL